MKHVMGHFVLGYPTMERSIEIAETYAREGIDILECQLPFSDPSADGTVIQNANIIAQRYSFDELLEGLQNVKSRCNTQIVIMTYITRIFHYGLEPFFKFCNQNGLTDFIIPDLPFDEAERIGILSLMKSYQCSLIPVISINTDFKRIKTLETYAFPFYYVMSYYGTTGKQFSENKELIVFIDQLKKKTKRRVAIGFGVKNATHVSAIFQFADIAVIGSELIRNSETEQSLTTFIQSLSSEIVV